MPLLPRFEHFSSFYRKSVLLVSKGPPPPGPHVHSPFCCCSQSLSSSSSHTSLVISPKFLFLLIKLPLPPPAPPPRTPSSFDLHCSSQNSLMPILIMMREFPPHPLITPSCSSFWQHEQKWVWRGGGRVTLDRRRKRDFSEEDEEVYKRGATGIYWFRKAERYTDRSIDRYMKCAINPWLVLNLASPAIYTFYFNVTRDGRSQLSSPAIVTTQRECYRSGRNAEQWIWTKRLHYKGR